MQSTERLGPMARSLIETFADLTLAQQQRVFHILREILTENELAAELMKSALASE